MGFIEDNMELQKKYRHDREPLNRSRLDFRMILLTEEFNETIASYIRGDAVEFVDGNVDLIVIALGNLLLAGVDIQKAWDAVHKANMNKVVGYNAKRPQSNGFDITKPDGWTPPDHSDNVGNLPEAFKA